MYNNESIPFDMETLELNQDELTKRVSELMLEVDKKVSECNSDPKFHNPAMTEQIPLRPVYSGPESIDDAYSIIIAYERGKTRTTDYIHVYYFPAPQKSIEQLPREKRLEAKKKFTDIDPRMDLRRGLYKLNELLLIDNVNVFMKALSGELSTIARSRK